MSHHLGAITSSAAEGYNKPEAGDVPQNYVTREMLVRIERSKYLFPYIDQLEASGVLSPLAAQQKRARVMDSVFKWAGVEGEGA